MIDNCVFLGISNLNFDLEMPEIDINYTILIYFKAANKYAEKGKELLAKVVFYRKPEDKQKLTLDA